MKAYSFAVESLVHNHNVVTIKAESEEEAWQKLRAKEFDEEDVFTYTYVGDDLDLYTSWAVEDTVPTAYYVYLEPPELESMVNLKDENDE